MADYHYCKLNFGRALLDALKHGDLREKCIMILLNAMNEKNIVKPGMQPGTDPKNKKRMRLVTAIVELTSEDKRRIQEQLKLLNDTGFGKWDKKKNIFVVHKDYARKGNSKYPPAYDGVNPQYNEEENGVILRLLTLFDTPYATIERKQNMNKAMLKKMDDINDTLNNKLSESNQRLMDMFQLMRMLLQKPHDTETREKVERALEKERHLHLA